jgi:hypothetical protein
VVLPDGPPSLRADMTPPVITLTVREWYQRAGNGDVKPRRKKATASRPGLSVGRRKGQLRTRRHNLQSARWGAALRSSSA